MATVTSKEIIDIVDPDTLDTHWEISDPSERDLDEDPTVKGQAKIIAPCGEEVFLTITKYRALRKALDKFFYIKE